MQIIYIPIILFILYLVFSALFSRLWNRNLSVELSFQKHAVTEGDQTFLTEVIANQNFIPLPMLQLKFKTAKELFFQSTGNVSVTDYSYISDIFSLHFFEKITRNLPVTCNARGYYTISSAALMASGFFSQNHFFMTQAQHTYLYVYPKLLDPIELETPYTQLNGDIMTKKFLLEDPFTFRGMRDYAPTDSPSSINWRAYAKTGSLKVNLHDSTSNQHVRLLLNLEKPYILYRPELLEDSIRITLTLATMLVNQHIPVSLLCNGLDIKTGSPVFIESGCSANHITSFCMGLSRINLTNPPTHFENYMKEEIMYSHSEVTTYCLISASTHKTLVEMLSELTAKNGSMSWICPTDQKIDSPVSNSLIHFFPLRFQYS